MAKAHRMTPARKAALRKAQLASARKRKKKPGHFKRNKKRYIKTAAYIGAVGFSLTPAGQAYTNKLMHFGEKAYVGAKKGAYYAGAMITGTGF